MDATGADSVLNFSSFKSVYIFYGRSGIILRCWSFYSNTIKSQECTSGTIIDDYVRRDNSSTKILCNTKGFTGLVMQSHAFTDIINSEISKNTYNPGDVIFPNGSGGSDKFTLLIII